jgi:hypothetical protein
MVGSWDPIALSATSSSGLPVVIEVTPGGTGQCSIEAGGKIAIKRLGELPQSCVVTVSAAGDAAYDPAPPVSRTVDWEPSIAKVKWGVVESPTSGTFVTSLSWVSTGPSPAVDLTPDGPCSVSSSTVDVPFGGSAPVTITLTGASCTVKAEPQGNDDVVDIEPAPLEIPPPKG